MAGGDWSSGFSLDWTENVWNRRRGVHVSLFYLIVSINVVVINSLLLNVAVDVFLSDRWLDGSPVTYVHWGPGEPNNANGEEECVQIKRYPGMTHRSTCIERHRSLKAFYDIINTILLLVLAKQFTLWILSIE